MRIKVNTISMLLIIISMLICFTIIVMYSELDENLMINRISRGYYGDDAIQFKFKDNEKVLDKTIELLKSSNQTDLSLIYDDYESGLRQIYIKGKYDSPPMLKGRFLKESDFFKKQNLAVIGKNSLKDIYDKNGKEYVHIDDKEFEIIGVMGYKTDTILDNMKVINMDSLSKNYENRIHILDNYSKNMGFRSQKNIKQIEKLFEDNNSAIEILDINPIGADRLLKTNINISIVFTLLLICFLLCNYTISIAWIEHHIKGIGIMKLVGWTDRNIKHYFYTRFILYSIIGMFLGLVLSLILSIEIKDNLTILYTLLFNLTLSFLSIVVRLNKVSSLSIAEVIK
ncbi:MAG: ABC transporter permease [Tissierella sp.]|uniref:ABC transporter permease n=1 Tax=Tissierella sp. TaxID=41274 RepID=UPI003F979451